MIKQPANRFIDVVIKSKNKGRIKKLAVAIFRRIARQKWVMPLIIKYVVSELTLLSSNKNSDKKIRLLVLNEERYKADLEVLSEHPDVELISLPSAVQHLINSLWVSELRELSQKNPVAYFECKEPAVIEVRNKLAIFLQDFILRLKYKVKFDALVTCTFYYRQDKDWEIAAEKIGIPFFAIHKENMKDPIVHKISIDGYKRKHIKFYGRRIFLFNELEKSVLLNADVSTEDKVSVVGGLRMDRIFKRTDSGDVKEPGRKVVLFSFHHCIGLLDIPDAIRYFSTRRDVGFVEYFDLVHGMVAQFAANNPDVEVVIKPKWEEEWNDHIRNAIERVTGINPDAIPNLKITGKVPAQTLIEESTVVVGLNSTTLLEAKLFGRRVVVPLLAEARGKYFDKHVYFHKYLDTFNTPGSPEEILVALDEELNGISPVRDLNHEMIRDYLGVYDGNVANRMVNIMRSEINVDKVQL